MKRQVADRLHFIGESPVLTISALSGKNVHRLRPALAGTIDAYHRRVPTRKVNEVIHAAQARHPAPDGPGAVRHAGRGRPADLHPLHQPGAAPTYLRYLENQLREAFDLGATPVKLRVRRRSS